MSLSFLAFCSHRTRVGKCLVAPSAQCPSLLLFYRELRGPFFEGTGWECGLPTPTSPQWSGSNGTLRGWVSAVFSQTCRVEQSPSQFLVGCLWVIEGPRAGVQMGWKPIFIHYWSLLLRNHHYPGVKWQLPMQEVHCVSGQWILSKLLQATPAGETKITSRDSRPAWPHWALRKELTLTLSNIIHSFSCLVFGKTKMKLVSNWPGVCSSWLCLAAEQRWEARASIKPGSADSPGAVGGLQTHRGVTSLCTPKGICDQGRRWCPSPNLKPSSLSPWNSLEMNPSSSEGPMSKLTQYAPQGALWCGSQWRSYRNFLTHDVGSTVLVTG